MTILPKMLDIKEIAAHNISYSAVLMLIAVALVSTLFSPSLALLLTLIGVVSSIKYATHLTNFSLITFSHAGSLIFASRTFDGASADFPNYFAVYETICRATEPLQNSIYVFGAEIGLPVSYLVMKSIGVCGMSIFGLAYLQGFLTSAATLLVIAKFSKYESDLDRRAVALVGMCLVYSFFYSTQLARQSISSIFVLSSLLIPKSRLFVFIQVMIATLFHLTAPLIWGAAFLMRKSSGLTLGIVLVASLIITFSFDAMVQYAVDSSGTVGALAKLAFYKTSTSEDGGVVSSDVLSIGLLAIAGCLLLWRGKQENHTRELHRIFFGFALLGLVLLPFPLAGTRLSLPFSSVAIGYFLLIGVAGISRSAAWLLVFLAMLFRVSTAVTAGTSDHALWSAYPAISWIPGYYFSTF